MTRIISISDYAYDSLNKIKAQKSFSEIIIEITAEKFKDKFLSSIGAWDKKFAEKLKKKIYNERKKLKSRRFK